MGSWQQERREQLSQEKLLGGAQKSAESEVVCLDGGSKEVQEVVVVLGKG